MCFMTTPPGSSFDDTISAAFAHGPASRNDLLTAAVAGRASTTVIEEILRLPDRQFDSPVEISAHLADPAA